MDFIGDLRKTIWSKEEEYKELLERNFSESVSFYIGLGTLGCGIAALIAVAKGNSVLFVVAAFLAYFFCWGLIMPVIAQKFLQMQRAKYDRVRVQKTFFYAAAPSLLFAMVPFLYYISTVLSIRNLYKGVGKQTKGWQFGEFLVFVITQAIGLFLFLLARAFLITLGGIGGSWM